MSLALAVLLAAPMSLSDAVQRAVAHDPGLRAAGLQVAEAVASQTVARGAFDLVLQSRFSLSDQTIDFGGETAERTEWRLDTSLVQPLVWGSRLTFAWNNSRVDASDAFRSCIFGLPVKECYQSALSLQFDQPLLRGRGRAVNEAPLRQAQATETAAAKLRLATASALVAEVVIDYVELAHARADAGIRQQALGLAEEQLAATRARIDAGSLAQVDLPVVEQAVAERRQSLFAARQRAADRGAALTIRVGTDGAPQVSLDTPPPWRANLVSALKAAEAHNPRLIAIDADLDRQKIALVTAQDATQASLDFSARASQSGVDDALGGALPGAADNTVTEYGASLSVAWPIANRVAKGNLARTRIALDRAREERAATLRDIRRATGSAHRGVRTAEGNVELAQTVVTLATRSLDAERRKFDHGRATNLDVLRIQQDLAESRLALARARSDRLLALTRLSQLTGTLLSRYSLALDGSPTP